MLVGKRKVMIIMSVKEDTQIRFLFFILLFFLLLNTSVDCAKGKGRKGKKGGKNILPFSGVNEYSRVSTSVQRLEPGVIVECL